MKNEKHLQIHSSKDFEHNLTTPLSGVEKHRLVGTKQFNWYLKIVPNLVRSNPGHGRRICIVRNMLKLSSVPAIRKEKHLSYNDRISRRL